MITYLSPPQIAEQWGVKPSKVIAFIDSGELKAVDLSERLGGKRRRWKVSPEAIEAFLQARTNRAPAKAVKRRRAAAPMEFFP